MLNVNQLRELIIKPALTDLLMYSEDASELLVFTCAVESNGGTYLKQINGPALGIYQMEPATYNDIWQNYLKHKSNLMLIMMNNFDIIRMPDEKRLVHDLRYATAMARIHYARVKEPLPSHDDTKAVYEYYKKYYNTNSGKANLDGCYAKYRKFTCF